MTEFTEVGDRVWVARQEWFDLNITAVGGEDGLLVVDTHASARAARGVVEDLRRLGAGDVVAVVNTHVHFDHTFGNQTFRQEYGDLPIHAHETVPADLPPHRDRVHGLYASDPDAPRGGEVTATEVLVPDQLLSSVRALDLGDRLVEVVHPGRGHTRGDVVVRVPDADVVVAGDLVEESAPPSYGVDCWPLDWPGSLDTLIGLTTPGTVVVPGHGAPMTREATDDQRHLVAVVAGTISDLAGRGVPADQALAAADWPWDPDLLLEAVRRGYQHLPREGKRLPMA